MGFKTDTSFLKYLTMGALGVRQVIEQLKSIGFHPFELERYCASNKIWTTKVKRLRLPDLICVKTGLRIEVKAKTSLSIKMSHAERNPERYWDTGLYPHDLIAFIACHTDGPNVSTAESALFFEVRDLQSEIVTAKLGPPKSASEGAERDLTWPCTVPKKDGEILEVNDEKIKTKLDTGRNQTYQLRGKKPYLAAGERFKGLESIIAGTVSGPIDIRNRLNDTWNPIELLHSDIDIDRYAATKALPFSDVVESIEAIPILEDMIDSEHDERVALEMASTLTRFNSQKGLDFICKKINDSIEPYIPMEAVFVLTEIANANSIQILENIVSNHGFIGNEIRQAAVWGLGKSGATAYGKLVPFIDDAEDEVALHAITAFGDDTDDSTIKKLIELLISGSPRQKAAACKSLSMIQSDNTIALLKQAAESTQEQQSWIISTLGQLRPNDVRLILANSPLLKKIEPFFHLSGHENWLATNEKDMDLKFLVAQNIV